MPPGARWAWSGAACRGPAGVPRPPLSWEVTHGPWYDNNLAILELRPAGIRMWWTAGEVVDGRQDRPVLRRVATVEISG